ncbi:MAG TPA: hypothetical protein VK961_01940 [Chthoniobacter sp.]|nr:hypothetical protein [Chthoniobacter sp.]
MTSFVKHIAVLAAALVATTALGDKTDDSKSPKPDSKDTKDPGKKSKKNKGSKATPNPDSPDAPAPPPKIQIPVVKGHDSKGLFIPYFDEAGKRQMDFQIAVASRIEDALIRMTDMDVLTYNDAGAKDMKINLPTSVYNTDTSAISTDYHVKISRDDFEIQGETMIFYTNTKQGALGGGVRMLIYNLKESTESDDSAKPKESTSKESSSKPQSDDSNMKPDGFKTPPSRSGTIDIKPDKLTPLRH